MLPRERQHEEISSDFYHGGMVVERSGKLHPALYYKGLLEACPARGRLAHGECAGRADHARERRLHAQDAAQAEVRAREVVIATNGYTGPATPSLRRRLIPVASHIIATEELAAELAASLIPKGRTISDTPRILTYYRLSPDGRRVLFGGRARFTQVTPEVSAPVLYRYMTERFPQLKGIKLTHAWTGNVAFTFDYLPHMGREDGHALCPRLQRQRRRDDELSRHGDGRGRSSAVPTASTPSTGATSRPVPSIAAIRGSFPLSAATTACATASTGRSAEARGLPRLVRCNIGTLPRARLALARFCR